MDISLGLATTFAILFYFLPAFIGRNKRNSTAIFVLNLLLGWSVIGWIIALIWSLTNDGETRATENVASVPPEPDPLLEKELEELRQMRLENKISAQDYQVQRQYLIKKAAE